LPIPGSGRRLDVRLRSLTPKIQARSSPSTCNSPVGEKLQTLDGLCKLPVQRSLRRPKDSLCHRAEPGPSTKATNLGAFWSTTRVVCRPWKWNNMMPLLNAAAFFAVGPVRREEGPGLAKAVSQGLPAIPTGGHQFAVFGPRTTLPTPVHHDRDGPHLLSRSTFPSTSSWKITRF